jgi:hypothetical protein
VCDYVFERARLSAAPQSPARFILFSQYFGNSNLNPASDILSLALPQGLTHAVLQPEAAAFL